jgi:hypothetical protein
VETTNGYELTWRGWRRNHLILVVVLVFVIEDPIVEDEDENVCRICVSLHVFMSSSTEE